MKFHQWIKKLIASVAVISIVAACEGKKMEQELEIAMALKPLSNQTPASQDIIDDATPEFSWSAPDAPVGASDYTIEVYNADDDSNVFTQTVTLNQNDPKQVAFNQQPLSYDQGYYWRVIANYGQAVSSEESSPTAFMLAENLDLVSADDFLSCEGNLVGDASFETSSQWVVSNGADLHPNGDGDLDTGIAVLHNGTGAVEQLSQMLNNSIVANNIYQLKISMRYQKQEHNPVQIKAWAYNGQPGVLAPGSDVALIGVTPPIPNITQWSRVSFEPWQATQNFEHIAFTLEDLERDSIVEIDRICLTETDALACDVPVDQATVASYLDQGAQEFVTEYEVGAVVDLYPDSDTSTTEWYANTSPTQNACFSIGGEVPQEQFDEIMSEVNEAELERFDDESESFEEKFDTRDLALTSASDIKPIKTFPDECSADGVLVPDNRPFGGRDIVYVHGLQMAAITDNLNAEPVYTGRWPQDPVAFGPLGGQYYDEAANHYWPEHIKRGLGSLVTPLNSYLIVSYSANQRLSYGIHAVLAQIEEAMRYNSAAPINWAGGKKGNCFGRNGVVLVSHSTGALLSSAMLGIAWESENSNELQDVYGDVSHIAKRIDAHVSINGALGGSPLATAGLMIANSTTATVLGSLQNSVSTYFEGVNPLDLISIRATLNQSVLVDLIPSISHAWASQYYGLSKTPTLTLSGGFPALAQGSAMTWPGKLIIPGFDDGVLSMASQSGSQLHRHLFNTYYTGDIKRLELVDMGVPLSMKRSGLGIERCVSNCFSSTLKNYPVNPNLSQTGMVQSSGVFSQVSTPLFWPNHYPVLQTTGDHFDDVNEVDDNGSDYQSSITGNNRNYEESMVVHSSRVYTDGLLSPAFGNLPRESVRRKTIGLHLPHFKLTWVEKRLFGRFTVKVPKILVRWVYHYIVLWKRTYHLLDGHENKTGMDYLYQYVLR